jgi:hypothetical protein
MRQWEILKGQPPGFKAPHWFVILSAAERCQEPKLHQVNALACFTLRGQPASRDVVLDTADGLEAPTAVPCDFVFVLDKAGLKDSRGLVSWERQQQIKQRLKDLLRL